MSQMETIACKPYIKYYSEDEIMEMGFKVVELLKLGKEDESDNLLKEIPLLPKSAQIMKKLYGAKHMIESGVNLYEAVQEYGWDWLND